MAQLLLQPFYVAILV